MSTLRRRGLCLRPAPCQTRDDEDAAEGADDDGAAADALAASLRGLASAAAGLSFKAVEFEKVPLLLLRDRATCGTLRCFRLPGGAPVVLVLRDWRTRGTAAVVVVRGAGLMRLLPPSGRRHQLPRAVHDGVRQPACTQLQHW